MLRQRRICTFAHTVVRVRRMWLGSAEARSEYKLENIGNIVRGWLRGDGEAYGDGEACGGADADAEEGLGTDGAAAAGEPETATWKLPS